MLMNSKINTHNAILFLLVSYWWVLYNPWCQNTVSAPDQTVYCNQVPITFIQHHDNDAGLVLKPAVFHLQLPAVLHQNTNLKTRKDFFIECLLPHILKVNQDIAAERIWLLQMRTKIAQDGTLSPAQHRKLKLIQTKYKLKVLDLNKLLHRVDIIPPSLALAQAIEETGWGTSYAARFKHSTFGITLSTGVKRYDNLFDNVESYILNLNVNPAYRKMRSIRSNLRQTNQTLCPTKLMSGLLHYSELRKCYLNKLDTHIRQNRLKIFDQSRLVIET